MQIILMLTSISILPLSSLTFFFFLLFFFFFFHLLPHLLLPGSANFFLTLPKSGAARCSRIKRPVLDICPFALFFNSNSLCFISLVTESATHCPFPFLPTSLSLPPSDFSSSSYIFLTSFSSFYSSPPSSLFFLSFLPLFYHQRSDSRDAIFDVKSRRRISAFGNEFRRFHHHFQPNLHFDQNPRCFIRQ